MGIGKTLPAWCGSVRCEWRPGARKLGGGRVRCRMGPGAEATAVVDPRRVEARGPKVGAR